MLLLRFDVFTTLVCDRSPLPLYVLVIKKRFEQIDCQYFPSAGASVGA